MNEQIEIEMQSFEDGELHTLFDYHGKQICLTTAYIDKYELLDHILDKITLEV